MENPLVEQCFSLLEQISSHPLFSILTTFFLLHLLYLPNLLYLLFSPVLITTSLILTALLHFGSSSPEQLSKDTNSVQTQLEHETPCESALLDAHEQKTNISCNYFLEWTRRGGPLEVIYEEYEGEEDDDDDSPQFSQSPECANIAISPAKSLHYFGYCSNTDSDEDSNGSSDDVCFRWDEEEEMIEIALEEDNLIEIDLSACR